MNMDALTIVGRIRDERDEARGGSGITRLRGLATAMIMETEMV